MSRVESIRTEPLRAEALREREERDLTAMLDLLHSHVPRHEPALDIWEELGPKVAAIVAEERLSLPERLRLRYRRFWENVAIGAVLFTQALAMHTEHTLRGYLMHDPLHSAFEE